MGGKQSTVLGVPHSSCVVARRSLVLAASALATLCYLPPDGRLVALAQEAYPAKPVKIVVGMPPGSFTDLTARLIGEELRADLGQSFVVENRPGAATNIATATVARAPNDGYTLLLASNSNTMNVTLYRNLPFDVRKDFIPVALITSAGFVLVVSPTLGVSNLQELIALARSKPGFLNFASTGSGTANHLAVEMFAQMAGAKVTTIFYKGSMEGVTDVIGGRVHGMFAPGSTAMPHVAAGTLKALGVTTPRRSAFAPDVPTVAEAGLPGYDVSMWNGLFAPVGTPPDIIQRLAAVATKAVRSAELQQKIKQNGGDPVALGPQEFADYVEKDIAKWAEVVKGAGIQPQQ